MTIQNIYSEIAVIHNQLADISVRGDDAIRMADALTRCRNLVSALAKQAQEDQSEPVAE